MLKGVECNLSVLNSGQILAPMACHESWMKDKVAAGWRYGSVKDIGKKESPCLLAYDELPVKEKIKDHLVCAVVTAFFTASLQHTPAK